MKSTILFSLGLLSAWVLQAQTNVTFLVNMQGLTINPNGVHIAGTFQSPQWQPGLTPMTDEDGDGVYAYSTVVPTGVPVQFKFINGNNWGPGQDENAPQACGVANGVGGFNRQFTPTTPTFTYGPVCFASCDDCPPAPQVEITFSVNMEQQMVSGDGVFVVGDPQTDALFEAPMNDGDGDGIYSTTLSFDANQSIVYRFKNGLASGDEEVVVGACAVTVDGEAYRQLEVMENAVVTDLVCFAECSDCIDEVPLIDLTLRVNMAEQIVSPIGVHVAGNFQNWSASATPLTDADGDGVYEVTVQVEENANLLYKFINGDDFSGAESIPSVCGLPDGFGAFNRALQLGTTDFVTDVVCFGQCADCATAEVPVNVTFLVNMANETVSADGVFVVGNFQNWTLGETPMSDDDGDGVFEVTLALPANDSLEFVFLNGNDWPFAESVPADCGIDNGFGGFNRSFYSGTVDVAYGPICFGSCFDCEPIVDPQTVSVTFLVNMANETVSTDGVQLVGNLQNWTLGATPMADGDGDGVYEVTLQLPVNESVAFVFINGNDWPFAESVPSDCGVDNGFGGFNRTFDVGEIDAQYGPFCFGQCVDCEPVVEPTTVNVTFSLNMSNETISASGVHIVGNFQGWTPGASQMNDDDGDGIYEFTAAVEVNTAVAYKFLNGDAWGAAEESVPMECGVDNGFGGYNRSLNLGSNDTTLQTVCFGTCEDCLPETIVILTLQVDMSNQSVSNDEVFVAGSFNGWDPAQGQMIPLGNGIYELPIAANSGELVSYKYINGTVWENVPAECGVDDMFGGFNRSVNAVNGNEVLPVVCFGECAPCQVIPTVSLTLTVDMSQEIVSPAGVFVAGTFNNFSPSTTEMEEIAPSIYRAVISVGENELQLFKFLNGPDFSGVEVVPFECGVDDGFGGFNRSVTTNEIDVTMPEVCFGYCASCAIATEEVTTDQPVVYPNPTSGMLNIEMHSPSTLSIYNSIGELVVSMQEPFARIQLDTQGWSSGVYHAVTQKGSSFTFVVK